MRSVPALRVTVLLRFGLLLAAALAMGCSEDQPTADVIPTSVADTPREKPLIAVIEPGHQHAFARTVRQGMANAAVDEDIEIRSFEGNDESALIQQLQLAAETRPDGVCIHASHVTDNVKLAIRSLHDGSTPVVSFYEDISAEEMVCCYVGTDHFHAGRRMVSALMERIDDDTTVIVVTAAPGDAHAKTRVHGFEFTMAEEHASVELVRASVSAGEAGQVRLQEALEATDNRPLTIVTFSAETTQTVLVAITDADLEATPTLVSFGAYPGIADDIRDEKVSCTLIEDPYILGLSTVIAVAAEIRGESAGGFVSTGEHLITAERLDDEGVQALLEANYRDG